MTDFEKRFAAARRRAIARDFRHLNEMQREAVLTTEGPLLLLAGAGSGKTTVLIDRIANLIRYGSGADSAVVPEHMDKDDLTFLEAYAVDPHPDPAEVERALPLLALEPVEPWRIIAITFTNKAADELRERLEARLGPEAGDVWAMTFHSACVRILRRDADRLGISRNFTIYDTSDSQTVMKRVLRELNLDEKSFPPRSVLAEISAAKDAMISPEDYCDSAARRNDIRQKAVGAAYQLYTRQLREADALDFDDLLLYAVRLLLEHEDVRTYYQRRFRHVLIDEYQDTNRLQYLLASTLAGGYENICVVGDDDQSIYKFRGATIENILNFEDQYKNARVIRLEQNYRSTGHILAAANAVIRNNQGRKGKNLWTEKDGGEKLKLYVAANESEEAQYVAGQVLAGFSGGQSWRDFAVLYRMNAQSNQLEYAFKRNGIPYRVIGGMRFFDRAEIKDMLAYLCVIANPADDLRLLRIVNSPARGIGAKTLETAGELAARDGLSLYQVLQRAREYPELQRAAVKLILFTNLIEDLRARVEETPLDQFYDLLLEESGYLAALREKDTPENVSRAENVQELRTNLVNFVNTAEDTSLFAFLDEVSLYTDLEEMDAEADCVVMMTMHSAKGLEFPTVFVVGAEDGIFPSLRAIGEPGEIEEERRLCYVAMTRAKERLVFTCARQRMLFGHTSSNKPSRFLDEIPSDDIDRPEPLNRAWADADDWSEERPRYTGHSYGSGTYRSEFSGRRGGYADRSGSAPSERRKKPSAVSAYAVQAPEKPAQTAAAAFQVGDRVTHKAFGPGKILSMKTAGRDALMEIEFESGGVKKMMLNTAAQFMTKR